MNDKAMPVAGHKRGLSAGRHVGDDLDLGHFFPKWRHCKGMQDPIRHENKDRVGIRFFKMISTLSKWECNYIVSGQGSVGCFKGQQMRLVAACKVSNHIETLGITCEAARSVIDVSGGVRNGPRLKSVAHFGVVLYH